MNTKDVKEYFGAVHEWLSKTIRINMATFVLLFGVQTIISYVGGAATLELWRMYQAKKVVAQTERTSISKASLAELEARILDAEHKFKTGYYNHNEELTPGLIKTIINNMKAMAGTYGSKKYEVYVPAGVKVVPPHD